MGLTVPPLCTAAAGPSPHCTSAHLTVCPRHREPLGVPRWARGPGPGCGGSGCGWVSPTQSGTLGAFLSAEDGPLRCEQLSLLLDRAEQFEAESRRSDEDVAFSVLRGGLNFDNCSLGEGRAQGAARRPGPAH